jgi:hypothetical protein
MGGQPILEGSLITMNFSVQITGLSGCNGYTADYGATAEKFYFTQTSWSRSAVKCPDPLVMSQEGVYFDLLSNSSDKWALQYMIDRSAQPEQLQVYDQYGSMILLYEAIPFQP